MLQSLSYKNVLLRGYAVIRDADDRPVSRAAALGPGAAISIQFADARVSAVTGSDAGTPLPPSDTPPTPSRKRSVKPAAPEKPPEQGNLF